jgi:hypothetical protein
MLLRSPILEHRVAQREPTRMKRTETGADHMSKERKKMRQGLFNVSECEGQIRVEERKQPSKAMNSSQVLLTNLGISSLVR